MDELEIRHSIPTGLQILLSDLSFLSQIKRNTKPCCSERVLVDSSSWAGALYRFYKGENRNQDISIIERIINQTVDAIEEHKNNDHIRIIVKYLSEAREGIFSLLTVYAEDPNIKARVKVQIDIVDNQLERFKHLIRGYRNEAPIYDKSCDKSSEDANEDNDFPGLNTENMENTETPDLFDANSESEKRKLRRHRIRKSLNKFD